MCIHVKIDYKYQFNNQITQTSLSINFNYSQQVHNSLAYPYM